LTNPIRCFLAITTAVLGLGCNDDGEVRTEPEASIAPDAGSADTGADAAACGRETITVVEGVGAVPNTFDRSVDAMLAEVLGAYSGTFDWDPLADLPVTHAGTSSPLTMNIGYDGGEIRLIEVTWHGEPHPIWPGEVPDCTNRIEIDARLEFATEDGLFAESWPTALEGEAFMYAGLHFRQELDFATHQGALKFNDFGGDRENNGHIMHHDLLSLALTGRFAAGTCDGYLACEYELELSPPDGGPAMPMGLAIGSHATYMAQRE
jgi:hypothetical protein